MKKILVLILLGIFITTPVFANYKPISEPKLVFVGDSVNTTEQKGN